MNSRGLNTMDTFMAGFRIKRDGKVYTLTEEEMFDFRFLDNAITGQNCLDWIIIVILQMMMKLM